MLQSITFILKKKKETQDGEQSRVGLSWGDAVQARGCTGW